MSKKEKQPSAELTESVRAEIATMIAASKKAMNENNDKLLMVTASEESLGHVMEFSPGYAIYGKIVEMAPIPGQVVIEYVASEIHQFLTELFPEISKLEIDAAAENI
jgi:hypothetical protein